MKYGEELQERSIPLWMPYNVDYNELKHLIKVNTTRDQGRAITIPGYSDTTLQRFEDQFYDELCNQHDRVDLFVKSKADEFNRTLREYQKRIYNLIRRGGVETGKGIDLRHRERLSRIETKVLRCGKDTRNLEHFVSSQRLAFRKILKKYKKWTGSPTLGIRFTDEVLSSPKSFTRRDFDPLVIEYNRLITTIHDAVPFQTGDSTPTLQSRSCLGSEDRRSLNHLFAAAQTQAQSTQQSYWNEYDDGSDVGDISEPYTISIDPDADPSFPGAKAAVYFFSSLCSHAKAPMEKIRRWLSPHSTPDERRSLLNSASSNCGYLTSRTNSIAATDTEVDDDVSSSDIPAGYATHHAKFASIPDQKLTRHGENLLLFGTVGSFFASFVLILVAGILTLTGRHRLRVEVDIGATVGVVTGLFFATIGLSIMLCHWQKCSWWHSCAVAVAFGIICVLSGMILVVLMGNT
ncbi:MAG: hypothetical protein M1818_005108 [Claussenomyces sp. TS43310]|nr:MAG: hypothetical protein M1818_005108 [Claussenomyces sp. TS43310]